jgi:hypothetical protein
MSISRGGSAAGRWLKFLAVNILGSLSTNELLSCLSDNFHALQCCIYRLSRFLDRICRDIGC